MDGPAILTLWMEAHEPALPEDSRLRFLARPEVATLARLDHISVRQAISLVKRLPEILALAEHLAMFAPYYGERGDNDVTTRRTRATREPSTPSRPRARPVAPLRAS